MRFTRFLLAALAFIGLAAARSTSDTAHAGLFSTNSYSATIADFGTFETVRITEQVGSVVDIWSVSDDGEATKLASATVGITGSVTFVLPEDGSTDLAVAVGVDIRDWLE